MFSVEETPTSRSGYPHPTGEDEPYDLVCVGFGPASLAIAVAMADKGIHKRVLYLEKQQRFRWHAGMLLPNARMQISFLKDLATLRDPQSKFTFLNYLKSKDRLVAFTNLSTFLPLREEYNDYLTWCALHFEQDVSYGHETTSIDPVKNLSGLIDRWLVHSRDLNTERTRTVIARQVVIAVGGRPRIPAALVDASSSPRIVHSSSYSTVVPQFLERQGKDLNIAVIGGGQSAAEIFHDLQSRFAVAGATLYTGDHALRPSDDSPFVNEIFDPDKVDEFYEFPSDIQQQTLDKNRATNYGVVRGELLDKLYENMYHQRLRESDENLWPYKITTRKHVVGYEKDATGALELRLRDTTSGLIKVSPERYDLAIVATGYVRNAHESILHSTEKYLEKGDFAVGRDYRVKYRPDELANGCGIWLQGCCEGTHGLSDTLLSILAVRGGEMVDHLFAS